MAEKVSEEALIALIQRLRAEPEFYFENCLKIQRFGTGELVPFTLNPVQKILHHMMERQLRELEHVRMIVLKARRFGMSTYVQGRYFRHAALNKNKVVQITTHSKAATDVMFSMTRTMEQNLPKEVKPQMKYSGKRELHWGGVYRNCNADSHDFTALPQRPKDVQECSIFIYFLSVRGPTKYKNHEKSKKNIKNQLEYHRRVI